MSRRARAGLFIEMDENYFGWVTMVGGLQDHLLILTKEEFKDSIERGKGFNERKSIGIVEEYALDSPVSCGDQILIALVQSITPNGNELLAFGMQTFNELISRNED